MFNRTKQLEKRLKALEDFLGIVIVSDDPDYIDYEFRANDYNGKLRGLLGGLFQGRSNKNK